MQHFRLSLLGCAIGMALAATTQATSYSNTIFFGDSLTDAGTYIGQPAILGLFPIEGRFTTNPGPVWTEILAARLGHSAIPANQGGTNYAAGGARVSAQPGYPDSALVPFIRTAPSVSQQISSYLTSNNGRANSSALYSVWAGANDLFALQDGGSTYSALPMPQVAANLAAQVERLSSAGARYILVPNLPDIGVTPSSITSGPAAQAQATALVQSFNTALYDSLAARGLRVIPVDIYGILNQTLLDAAKFGITNTTGTACAGQPTSLVCGPGEYAAGSEESYLFADGVHPSTGTHARQADFVASILAAPQQIARLADTSLSQQKSQQAMVRTQMLQAGQIRRRDGQHLWINAAGGEWDEDDAGLAPSVSADQRSLMVGVDFQIDNDWATGVALAFRSSESTLGDNRGKQDQESVSLTLSGLWEPGTPWYGFSSLSYGALDYESLRRIAIGRVNYSVKGDSDGQLLAAALETGYRMEFGHITTGPLISVLSQHLTIDSFNEKGTEVFTMGFGEQERDRLIASLGWQVNYKMNGLEAFARIALDQNLMDNDHSVVVKNLTIPNALPYSMAVTGEDESGYSLQAGFSGNLTDDIRYQLGALGQDTGSEQQWQAYGGVQLAF